MQEPWNTSKALWSVVQSGGIVLRWSSGYGSWDPGSIPGRDTSFDVPELPVSSLAPDFQLDSRYKTLLEMERDCAWGGSGDKPYLRKSTDRKAQISPLGERRASWFVLCDLICHGRFSQVRFHPEPPEVHASSLFLQQPCNLRLKINPDGWRVWPHQQGLKNWAIWREGYR